MNPMSDDQSGSQDVTADGERAARARGGGSGATVPPGGSVSGSRMGPDGGDGRRRPGGAGTEPMSWFTRVWSWIGGVDVTGMNRAERARASVVPMLLLVPAGMALFAGFLFAREFGVSGPAAGLIAIIWSGVIFTIDRAFVVIPTRPGWRAPALVLRLLVAGLIGFVVAEPLVAALFSEDIDAQVEIVRETKRQEALTEIASSPRYGDLAIGEARKRLDRARQAVNFTGSDSGDVAADPEVTRLRGELDAAEQARARQAATVQTERDGTGGTGRAGEGPRFEEKLQELNRLEAEIGSKRAALGEAESAAASRSAESRVAESGAARTELPAVEADVAAREAERRAVEIVAQDTSEGNSLGIRTEAFAELRKSNSFVAWRYWLITALLIVLDVAAVLVKSFMRPPVTEELEEIDRTGQVERRRLANGHLAEEQQVMFAEDSARNASVRAAMQVDFDERLRSMIEDGRGSERPVDLRSQEWVDQADEEARYARQARRWWDH